MLLVAPHSYTTSLILLKNSLSSLGQSDVHVHVIVWTLWVSEQKETLTQTGLHCFSWYFFSVFQNTEEKLENIIGYADIFLVLYSITDRNSFQEAGKIVKYIRRYRTLDSSSIIIAGTKTDLEHFRTVRETDGSRLTYSLNCGFFEISISENYGDTLNMFNDILRQYLNAHPSHESSSVTSSCPSPTPPSPLLPHKEMKSPSSWAKVKGLKTMPFRRKSTQTPAC